MKRGITVERKYDHNDIPCIVIKKKRGKLALDEIQDILRFEDYQQWNGQYVLFLNCSEATLGGNGCWDLLDEPPGDKVMQMKNRDFASNGDIGYICTSTQGEDGLLVEVDFGDDRVVAYEDIEALRQLELAYATTIHKSQGSEYDAVLINIQDMHGKMLNRALFYTAETRAKKRVIIVGDWDAVVRAIQTADTKRRHTMLAMRINELTKE